MNSSTIFDSSAYQNLDPDWIIDAIHTLPKRIEESFPGSSLYRIGLQLLHVGQNTARCAKWIPALEEPFFEF